MKRPLKTTTAIAASLSLLLPHLAMAQEAGPAEVLEECDPDTTAQDCMEATEEVLEGGVASEQPLGAEIEDPAETMDEAAEQPLDGEETPSSVNTSPDGGGYVEPGGGETGTPAETDMPSGGAAPEVQTTGEDAQPSQSDVTAPEAEDPPVATEAELPQSETTPAEAGTTATSDDAEQAPAEDMAQDPAETPADPTEQDIMERLQSGLPEEAGTEGETGQALTDPADSGQAVTTGEGQPDQAVTEQAETQAPDQAQDPAAEIATGSADVVSPEEEAIEGGAVETAATEADAEPEEVQTETVTEETARSSDEEFDTGISRQDGARARDDGGLSRLEQALLIGAGGLAVGALLNNRRVVAASDDRVVVSRDDGGFEVIKDDNALLRRPGANVETETFGDGSTRTTVTYEDGSRVVTIRDERMRIVRRSRITPDGQEIVLVDDTQDVQPVNVSQLQPNAQDSLTVDLDSMDQLAAALRAERTFDRSFSLNQVREIADVRRQVPAVDLDNITFESGSAAISPSQAQELTALGRYIRDETARDPRAIFLVEGHTDAVGDDAYNLALSDRRAESVALALTEYFDVPPSNLVVQGYGERFLKVETQSAERANRRATIRDITPLLQVAAATR